jgi:opacity protein-like surface antigen
MFPGLGARLGAAKEPQVQETAGRSLLRFHFTRRNPGKAVRLGNTGKSRRVFMNCFMLSRVVLLLAIACAVAGGGAAKVSAQSGSSEQSGGSDSACVSNVPRSLFFVGAGAGLDIVASGQQSVFNKGISNIFEGGSLVSTGEAEGPPVTPTLKTKSDFVPLVQLGYFQHLGNSDWLWGIKYSYIYQDKNLVKDNLIIPQLGTSSDPNNPTFNGFSVTRSYEVFIDHQMTLMPFIGRSFKNCFVYAGAGPSLSRVGASLNDVVGFADFTGTGPLSGLIDVSGRPQSDSQTQWAFGIAASVGFTYFITPCWFLDVGYTFSNPFPHKFHVEGPFENDAFSPTILTGTLIGDYTAKVNTHSITVSLNFGF